MPSRQIIADVHGRQVLDSRGAPTLEVEVRLESGACGHAMVPAGASTGTREPKECRDGDRRYRGLGTRTAVRHVREEIGEALRGRDAADQAAIDEILVRIDGTPDRSRLGANALLGASLACAHAAAAHEGLALWRRLATDGTHELPVPMLNVLNGGAHADNALDVQEVMLVPWEAESFADALHVAVQVTWSLRDLLSERGQATAVGDEGGFAPELSGTDAALDLLEAAIERAGYHPGEQVVLAVDAAASQWRTGGRYHLAGEGVDLTSDELVDRWATLLDRHPVIALEDPLAEDDVQAWAALHARVGDRVQLIGDDVFVTNAALVRQGAERGLANALLVKPNQAGTLTETLQAIAAARTAGWGIVVSHRSGETEDTTIADLAVGVGAGQIKAGAPCRGERIAKYNRLLRIEEELGDDALYAGRAPFERQRSQPFRW